MSDLEFKELARNWTPEEKEVFTDFWFQLFMFALAIGLVVVLGYFTVLAVMVGK